MAGYSGEGWASIVTAGADVSPHFRRCFGPAAMTGAGRQQNDGSGDGMSESCHPLGLSTMPTRDKEVNEAHRKAVPLA